MLPGGNKDGYTAERIDAKEKPWEEPFDTKQTVRNRIDTVWEASGGSKMVGF